MIGLIITVLNLTFTICIHANEFDGYSKEIAAHISKLRNFLNSQNRCYLGFVAVDKNPTDKMPHFTIGSD